MKSLILFTTGRGIDLVIWEIKNQTEYAGVPLLSFSNISGEYDFPIDSVDPSNAHIGEHSSSSVSNSCKKRFKDVLFRARFHCTEADINILKEALGNCVLLRIAYAVEIATAVGTDLLWNILSEKGLSTSVSGEILQRIQAHHF